LVDREGGRPEWKGNRDEDEEACFGDVKAEGERERDVSEEKTRLLLEIT
jgi:hypothetical protein